MKVVRTVGTYLPGFVLASAMACSGEVNTPDPQGSAGGAGTVGDETSQQGFLPGDRGVTRLTLRQYDNSVADLLGSTRRFGSEQENAPVDGALAGYEVGLTPMGELYAEALIFAAEAASADAIYDMPTLLQCDVAASGEAVCAQAFIESFGRRAFRRTLTDDERARLLALYERDLPEFGFEQAIRSVLESILLSPRFLHHIDPAVDLDGAVAPGSLVSLQGVGLASRLSYQLWGSVPDDTLLAVAEAGELATREQVRAQATRMLADPRATRAFLDFASQWLQFFRLDNPTMDKEPEHYVGFDETTKASFKASLQASVYDALASDSATQLFTSNQLYANESMAPFLGIPGTFGADLELVEMEPSERFGLLTHPSLMAMLALPGETAPFKRALFAWEQLFCQDLPDPITDIPAAPEGLDPSLSVREVLAIRTEPAACFGCHSRMNPVGFSFEHYGPLGEYRNTDDRGVAVDAATEIVGSPGLDGPVNSALDLAHRLADSDVPYACLMRQYYRSMASRLEAGDERLTLEEMGGRFREDGGRFSGMVLDLIDTPTFLTRVYQEDSE